MNDVPEYHAIGVGAGPANLSFAALFESATTEQIALFDRQPTSGWHNRLLHSGVRMQTSWLKDLVTIVDPRHELSFLNYLVTTGRTFALLNAQFDFLPRREYVRYLAWAAERMRHVHYGVTIDRISLRDGGFEVASADGVMGRSEHLVIGVGSRPAVPSAFAHLPTDRTFIADELAGRIDAMAADRDAPVAVVGGRQTGIEAVLRLLSAGFTNISWFGRRLWFETIDDSPNANDVYRPAHVEALQRLSPITRRRVIEDLRPTGDALTPGVMRSLYQANYDGMLELGHFPVTLYPARDVIAGEVVGDDIVLTAQTPERRERHQVRHVVLATGRESVEVPFDDDLRERIEVDADGEMVVEPDYSVRWKGMNGHRIYALNRATMTLGLPDSNLTLLPVRSAIVLNSMFGREIYSVRDELSPVSWG